MLPGVFARHESNHDSTEGIGQRVSQGIEALAVCSSCQAYESAANYEILGFGVVLLRLLSFE